MANEKRTPRTYKATEPVYKKAMSRAKREKVKLSNLLENVAIAYAAGMDIKAVKINDNVGHALDIFSENLSIRIGELNKVK